MRRGTQDGVTVSDDLALRIERDRGIDDLITIKGRMRAELRGADGELKQVVEVENLITTVGRNSIVDQLLASPAVAKPTHMAVGTGSTAEAVGNTALVAEVATTGRQALTSKTRSTNVLTMVANWAAGQATATIAEAGVFNAASAGDMYSRATFTAIPKAASDTLQITWTYTIG